MLGGWVRVKFVVSPILPNRLLKKTPCLLLADIPPLTLLTTGPVVQSLSVRGW